MIDPAIVLTCFRTIFFQAGREKVIIHLFINVSADNINVSADNN